MLLQISLPLGKKLIKSRRKIEILSIFIHLGRRVRILTPFMGHFPLWLLIETPLSHPNMGYSGDLKDDDWDIFVRFY